MTHDVSVLSLDSSIMIENGLDILSVVVLLLSMIIASLPFSYLEVNQDNAARCEAVSGTYNQLSCCRGTQQMDHLTGSPRMPRNDYSTTRTPASLHLLYGYLSLCIIGHPKQVMRMKNRIQFVIKNHRCY